ncbi:hypothetical protein A45J_1240 [hot springs metagenome]|uniref:Uncharacterized protein n=1 Tax=hot springs metagenome TaxID=433727 RepID=A0A5J4L7F1_9ZZZZ
MFEPKRLAVVLYEKTEAKNHGKGTIVCNSWEEFDEAMDAPPYLVY